MEILCAEEYHLWGNDRYLYCDLYLIPFFLKKHVIINSDGTA